MKLLVLKENNKSENRVAISLELVQKYQKLGFEIFIEKDAGLKSNIDNDEFEKNGAKICDNISAIINQMDIILSVQRIDIENLNFKNEAVLICLANPYFQKEKIKNISEKNISLFALELLPRISRAQYIDVLSSQSNIAGYRAVIDGAYEIQKCLPMMITAAGTISAAKFMIIGAGVAGLQAIATAKRLGAIVCAFDVRSSAKEQVNSLGAKFIEVQNSESYDGVYAKEMGDEYKKQQEKLLFDTIKNQDVVISTALIPNKKAPILITKEMVASMKKGSVIIDISAVNGGNCELTKIGEKIDYNGVKIIGYENYPSRVANDASKLFAKNIFNFIEQIIDKQKKSIVINYQDEIIKSTLIVHQNKILKEDLKIN